MQKYKLQFVQIIGINAFAFILASIATQATWKKLTQSFLGIPGDAYYYLWSGIEVKNNHFLPILKFGNLPDGINLLQTDHPLPSYILACLMNFVAPTLAYNLLSISILAINGISVFYLTFYISKSKILSVTLLIVAIFLPSSVLRVMGHLPLLATFPLTLFLLVLVMIEARSIKKEKNIPDVKKNNLYLSIILSIILISSAYWSVYFFLIETVIFFIYLRSIRKYLFLLNLKLILLITGFGLSPLIYIKMNLFLQENLSAENNHLQQADNLGILKQNSLDLASFVIPPRFSRNIELSRFSEKFHLPPNVLEGTLFIGLPLFVVVIFGMYLAYRPQFNKFRYLSLSLILIFLISIGPLLKINSNELFSPVSWIYHFPPFTQFRVPTRFLQLSFGLYVVFICIFFNFLRSQTQQMILCLSLLITAVTFPVQANWIPISEEFAGIESVNSSNVAKPKFLVIPNDCGGDQIPLGFAIVSNLQPVGCFGQSSSLPWYSGFTDFKSSKALSSLRCNPNLYGYASSPNIKSYWKDLEVSTEIIQRELKKDLGLSYILVDLTFLNSKSCQDASLRIESTLSDMDLLSKSKNGRWELYSLF